MPSLALFQSIYLYVYLGTYLTLFLFVGHANLFTIYLYLYLYLFLTTFNFSTYISFYLPIYLLLASLFLCTSISFYVSTINSSASYASFCISLWLPVNLVICSLHSPLFLHLPICFSPVHPYICSMQLPKNHPVYDHSVFSSPQSPSMSLLSNVMPVCLAVFKFSRSLSNHLVDLKHFSLLFRIIVAS